MSRSYSISVSESVHRHVHVKDGIQTRLDLLTILSPSEMAALLAEQLAAIGFERTDADADEEAEDGDVVLVRIDDSPLGPVRVEVNTSTATVAVRLQASAEVEHTIDRTGRVEEEVLEAGRERLRQRVVAELESHVEAERSKLAGEVADVLEDSLRNLRKELGTATTRATAAALKIRAGQIGEIQEISEDAETGELTIVVEV